MMVTALLEGISALPPRFLREFRAGLDLTLRSDIRGLLGT